MEGHNRRRRQNEPPQYANLDERFPQGHQDLGRNFSDGSADRYRQPGPSSRSSASAISNYGYYAEPAPPFPATPPVDQMSYQTEYAQVPRQLQANFTAYGTNLNYGINQQPHGSIVYEPASQFQPRQSPPVQMLSDTSSFYASESMASIGMPGTSTEETRDTPSTIDQAYRRFNVDLGRIFQHIVNGNLVVASQLLMRFSEWLISHVEDMGTSQCHFLIRISIDIGFYCAELTLDDAARENARSKLWDDFNHAWLALMQKQKTSTEELLQAGISLQQPQLLSCNEINKMCGELIKLNDEFLERHGLVNYQYGVLEDQIINSMSLCHNLSTPYGHSHGLTDI